MTHEELELLTYTRDFTTLLYVILRPKPKLLESSMKSDFGMQFALWSLDLAIRDFAFCQHSF